MKFIARHKPPANPSVVEKLLRARDKSPLGAGSRPRLGKWAEAGKLSNSKPGHGNWKSRAAQKKRITLPRIGGVP
jgi:hypothetical protein